MELCYIDESYDAGLFALSMLIVPDHTWADCFGIVKDFRKRHNDAYYFNWRLKIDSNFQQPFSSSHEDMAGIEISGDLPSHVLAANLRRVFSGIVSGNVRDDAMAAIEQKGPYEINGSPRILSLLDRLLTAFVAQGRMKLAADDYSPCYRVIS